MQDGIRKDCLWCYLEVEIWLECSTVVAVVVADVTVADDNAVLSGFDSALHLLLIPTEKKKQN